MTEEQQEQLDVSLAWLMEIIREKEQSKMSWSSFIAGLQAAVAQAERKLDMAYRVQDLCTATKPRKTRRDKGQPRKKPLTQQ